MTAPSLPTPGVGPGSAVLARVRRRARAERTPLVGTIEVTARCNLRCVHCFLGDHAGSDVARPEISAVGDPISRRLSRGSWLPPPLAHGGRAAPSAGLRGGLPSFARERDPRHRLHERHPGHRRTCGPVPRASPDQDRRERLRRHPGDLRIRDRRGRVLRAVPCRGTAAHRSWNRRHAQDRRSPEEPARGQRDGGTSRGASESSSGWTPWSAPRWTAIRRHSPNGSSR